MQPKTKCPGCKESKGFELVHESVVGSSLQISIIRCAECFTALGVLEFDSTVDMLKSIGKKLDLIDNKIESLLARHH